MLHSGANGLQKKATVGNMHLHCDLWHCIVGTTNMETISDVTNGDLHGQKQIRVEYEFSQFDCVSAQAHRRRQIGCVHEVRASQ